MTQEQIKNALAFMHRAWRSPQEVAAFDEVVSAIVALAEPPPPPPKPPKGSTNA